MDYKEKLERAKELYPTANADQRYVLECLFPELAESDERIRKALIELVRMVDKNPIGQIFGYGDIKYSDMIAWLEKQGEYKYTEEDMDNAYKCADGVQYKRGYEDALKELEKQGENKQILANSAKTCKNEPKFKVGDWITGYYNSYKVIDITKDGYKVEDVKGDKLFILFENESFHFLWTIKDAKDGDVLASNNSVFIFQEEYVAEKPTAYCGLINGLFVGGNDACWTNEKCYPATKEQRDTLFAKIKEAGYEWNAEKKELKLLITNGGDFDSENREQKPTEYDIDVLERHITKDSVSELAHTVIARNGWVIVEKEQKSAWSEEDENMIEAIEALCDDKIRFTEFQDVKEYAYKVKDWLKSLKQRIGG